MPGPISPAQARALNDVIELHHAIAYFAPEFSQAWEGFGLEPRGQGYVVGRAAPLGRIAPATGAAVFNNFNPALFQHALADVWDSVSPEQVLAARAAAFEAVMERVAAPTDDLAEATELARTAGASAQTHGRPLAAANQAVPLPGTPHADLWQALAVVREHRGDGHVAVLVSSGLRPVEALVLYAGWQTQVSRRFLQRSRLWDDEAWAAAEDDLRATGLLDADGALTDDGRALRDQVEDDTDRLATQPYTAIGPDGAARLFELVRTQVLALADGEAYPRRPVVRDDWPA